MPSPPPTSRSFSLPSTNPTLSPVTTASAPSPALSTSSSASSCSPSRLTAFGSGRPSFSSTGSYTSLDDDGASIYSAQRPGSSSDELPTQGPPRHQPPVRMNSGAKRFRHYVAMGNSLLHADQSSQVLCHSPEALSHFPDADKQDIPREPKSVGDSKLVGFGSVVPGKGNYVEGPLVAEAGTICNEQGEPACLHDEPESETATAPVPVTLTAPGGHDSSPPTTALIHATPVTPKAPKVSRPLTSPASSTPVSAPPRSASTSAFSLPLTYLSSPSYDHSPGYDPVSGSWDSYSSFHASNYRPKDLSNFEPPDPDLEQENDSAPKRSVFRQGWLGWGAPKQPASGEGASNDAEDDDDGMPFQKFRYSSRNMGKSSSASAALPAPSNNFRDRDSASSWASSFGDSLSPTSASFDGASQRFSSGGSSTRSHESVQSFASFGSSDASRLSTESNVTSWSTYGLGLSPRSSSSSSLEHQLARVRSMQQEEKKNSVVLTEEDAADREIRENWDVLEEDPDEGEWRILKRKNEEDHYAGKRFGVGREILGKRPAPASCFISVCPAPNQSPPLGTAVTRKCWTISCTLPGFVREEILVAMKKRGSVHVLADRFGEGGGHFERLVQFGRVGAARKNRERVELHANPTTVAGRTVKAGWDERTGVLTVEIGIKRPKDKDRDEGSDLGSWISSRESSPMRDVQKEGETHPVREVDRGGGAASPISEVETTRSGTIKKRPPGTIFIPAPNSYVIGSPLSIVSAALESPKGLGMLPAPILDDNNHIKLGDSDDRDHLSPLSSGATPIAPTHPPRAPYTPARMDSYGSGGSGGSNGLATGETTPRVEAPGFVL